MVQHKPLQPQCPRSVLRFSVPRTRRAAAEVVVVVVVVEAAVVAEK